MNRNISWMMDFKFGSILSLEIARLLRYKYIIDNKYFHIKSISCVDIIKCNWMSTLTKSSLFPKTIRLSHSVFPKLLGGVTVLNQPSLLFLGVISLRDVDVDKLSFVTSLFLWIQVFNHNWPYSLLALHGLNRCDKSHENLHT